HFSSSPLIYTLSLHDALPILHQINALRVLVLVDDAILQRQIVVTEARGAVVRFRIELEELFGDGIQAIRGNDVAGKRRARPCGADRKSTRLNSSHQIISYAVF